MSVTDKVSISIGRHELRQARRLASKLGQSLSTFISHAVREQVAEQERREAAAAVLATFAPEDRASPQEMAELLTQWAAAPAAAARSRRHTGRRAAAAASAPTRTARRHGR